MNSLLQNLSLNLNLLQVDHGTLQPPLGGLRPRPHLAGCVPVRPHRVHLDAQYLGIRALRVLRAKMSTCVHLRPLRATLKKCVHIRASTPLTTPHEAATWGSAHEPVHVPVIPHAARPLGVGRTDFVRPLTSENHGSASPPSPIPRAMAGLPASQPLGLCCPSPVKGHLFRRVFNRQRERNIPCLFTSAFAIS
jgi:hypothetical protein